VIDAWRFAIGTFTRFPVPPPRAITGWGIALAPIVAVLVVFPIGALGQWAALAVSPWLVALGILAVLTWVNRALHLDGLADTADALGSAQPAEQALAIARRSDIGPMGVLTLIFVVLAQLIGLAQVPGHLIVALVVAAVTSRIALVVSCTPAFPAARIDGLGAAIAGSVPPMVAIAWVVSLAAGTIGYAWWAQAVIVPIAAAVGLIAGIAMSLVARRRLGGITGDTLGASVEVAFTASIVAIAISAA
jgi:adenosylcobinamide-GDP ribazoletransferase